MPQELLEDVLDAIETAVNTGRPSDVAAFTRDHGLDYDSNDFATIPNVNTFEWFEEQTAPVGGRWGPLAQHDCNVVFDIRASGSETVPPAKNASKAATHIIKALVGNPLLDGSGKPRVTQISRLGRKLERRPGDVPFCLLRLVLGVNYQTLISDPTKRTE